MEYELIARLPLEAYGEKIVWSLDNKVLGLVKLEAIKRVAKKPTGQLAIAQDPSDPRVFPFENS